MSLETGQRPWGSYDVLLEEEYCKVKRIYVNPGHRLSYQYHLHREEVWTIVSGEAVVVLEGEEIVLKKGDVIKIPQGSKHRIGNIADQDLVFIEVQMGTYFGEDDIIRLADDYFRNQDK